MWINEIEDSIQNGFHDSCLEKVQIDYLNKIAIMTIMVDITDWDKKPKPNYTRKKGLLEIKGLEYFSIPLPDGEIGGKATEGVGMSQGFYDDVKVFGTEVKGCRFYIEELNAYIVLTGKTATFKWI